jgi:2'-phosphotransferase
MSPSCQQARTNDKLARPKMRGIDVETVLKLVEENAKKRFEVVWGYDPSPPLPVKKKGQNQKKAKKAPVEDAAEVDDLRKEMEQAMLADKPEVEEWKELPLVVVDKEAEGDDGAEWFIRASQGHSIKLEGTAHLTPVEDDEEGRERVGLMVHGTRDDLWDTIRACPPTLSASSVSLIKQAKQDYQKWTGNIFI